MLTRAGIYSFNKDSGIHDCRGHVALHLTDRGKMDEITVRKNKAKVATRSLDPVTTEHRPQYLRNRVWHGRTASLKQRRHHCPLFLSSKNDVQHLVSLCEFYRQLIPHLGILL